jgi:integrase
MDISKKSHRLKAEIGRLYTVRIGNGLYLGYRRGQRQGAWSVKLKVDDPNRHRFAYVYATLGESDDTAWGGLNRLDYDKALEAARQWAKRKEQDANNEVHSGSYTVSDAWSDYIAEQERIKRKPQPRARAVAIAHILPALGNIELSKLNHTRLKRWRDGLAEKGPRVRAKAGKPPAHRTVDMADPEQQRARQASANRTWTYLRAALNHSFVERKVASKGAWEAIKPFRRTDSPRVRFLSLVDAAALIRACEPDFKALVTGALQTGCRLGELTDMLVSAFEPEHGRCFIPTSKSGKPRHVDLTPEGCAFFEQMTAGRSGSERMFLRNGVAWKPSEQQRPMNEACKVAAIEDANFHCLRHTWASHSVMNGCPLQVVSEQLGHADLRVTVRFYAHLAPAYRREAVRSFAPSFGVTADTER